MNTFDSPIEALALAYVGFDLLTLVSNIWTWVAVITAAYSLWKIRATTSPKFNPHHVNPDVNHPPPPPPTQKAAESALASTPSLSLPAAESDGIARGTEFSLYYESEREGGEEKLAWTGEVDGGDAVANGGGEWCDGWETIWRNRMRLNGNVSWYSLQDLTMLDGNVVRLWDDNDINGRQKVLSQMVFCGNCY